MDAHTHDAKAHDSVYILGLEEVLAGKAVEQSFCAGLHPWELSKLPQGISVEQVLAPFRGSADFVAIGETGLDHLRPDPALQLRIFLEHWRLSESWQKPLVLHCVRAQSEIIALLKKHPAAMPWLWHAASIPLPQLEQLLGLHPQLHFSFGPREIRRANFQAMWELIPPQRRLIESDDSGVAIEEVCRLAHADAKVMRENRDRLFGLS